MNNIGTRWGSADTFFRLLLEFVFLKKLSDDASSPWPIEWSVTTQFRFMSEGNQGDSKAKTLRFRLDLKCFLLNVC